MFSAVNNMLLCYQVLIMIVFVSLCTKIDNLFNKCKPEIVQLNFNTNVVSLPGSSERLPPDNRII